MTEEEFRAQMDGIDEGPAVVPTVPKAMPKALAFGSREPPKTTQVAPGTYQTRPFVARPPPAYKPRPGGFAGTMLPLVVRQSQKDGSFNIAGKMAFSIKLDQEAIQHVTQTGEGLSGRDSTGQWQEGFKVGELTVWPPYEKKPG